MKTARFLALTASAGLAISFLAASSAAVSASASPRPTRVTLHNSATPALERSHQIGKVAADSKVTFDLLLRLRNASGAAAFTRAVSSPGSRQFHHYLTDAQWVSRYAPAKTAVAKAESWLRHNYFSVKSVAKDRLYVTATGTASRIERTFGVSLGYYMVTGHKVRLASGTLSIPSSMAGTVTGVVGVNEYIATTGLAAVPAAPAGKKAKPDQEPPPPAGFRNPQPCSAYWGQKTDTADSGSLYAPYTAPLPYDICGYKRLSSGAPTGWPDQ